MTKKPVVKSIRDPVHGFVYLTPIEQLLVDKPEFQRLRFVLQQSTAYQTFPSNTTNRFAHSLGAAHLAGQMFLCAINNASREDLDNFVKDTSSLFALIKAHTNIPLHIATMRNEIHELIGDPTLFLAYPPVEELPRVIPEEFRPCVAVLWQSVRLATLVHDLGHLPMSHLFETAIDQFDPTHPVLGKVKSSVHDTYHEELAKKFDQWDDLIEDEPAIHEMIGCVLFDKLLPTCDMFSPNGNLLYQFIAWIAKTIVLIKPSYMDPSTSQKVTGMRVVRFLHSVIAGEIDADRLDYSVRDPLAASSEFGSINLRRLVRGQVLVCHKEEYLLAIDRRALPDVESFFIQRYFAFRTIVSDHNVSRMEAILRQILEDLVVEAARPDSPIRDIACQYDFWKPDEGDGKLGPLVANPDLIGRFDDTWLRSFLYSSLIALKNPQQKKRVNDKCRRLTAFIEILLHRRVSECWTVAKTDVDTFTLMDEVVSAILATEPNEEPGIPDSLKMVGPKGKTRRKKEDKKLAQRLVNAIFCGNAARKPIEARLRAEISKHNEQGNEPLEVLVHFEKLKFPPVDLCEYQFFVRGETAKDLRILGSVSPLLSAMSKEINGGKRVPQLRIFIIGTQIDRLRNTRDGDNCKQLRSACIAALAAAAMDVSKEALARR